MIRPADISDAKAIAHIRVDGWKTTYKGMMPDSFLSKLNYEEEEERDKKRLLGNDNNFTSKIVVYEENNEILGFAFYGNAIDSSYDGEILALYVKPRMKRHGIGNKLVNYIKQELKNSGKTNMVIWCLKDNINSIKFYEKMGGKPLDTRNINIAGTNLTEVGLVYEL